MDKFLAPEQLRDSGSLSEGWEKFKKEFELFLVASEKKEADGKVKTAILLRTIGSRGTDIYDNFLFDNEEDKLDYDMVVAKFDEFCKPKNLLFIERHRLLNMKQDGMSVEQFETKLRTQARQCGFKDLKDDLTCHAFLEGVDDKALKDKLFMKACSGELTLEAAVSLAKEFEAAKAHLKEMERVAVSPIHKIDQSGTRGRGAMRSVSNFVNKCGYCGSGHAKGRCPAFGKICDNCGGRNHFKKACHKEARQEVKSVEVYEDLLVCQPVKRRKRLLIPLEMVGGSVLECQVDTAAARNVMSMVDYQKLSQGQPPLSTQWNHPDHLQR
jgi:hypothetical protein